MTRLQSVITRIVPCNKIQNEFQIHSKCQPLIAGSTSSSTQALNPFLTPFSPVISFALFALCWLPHSLYTCCASFSACCSSLPAAISQQMRDQNLFIHTAAFLSFPGLT